MGGSRAKSKAKSNKGHTSDGPAAKGGKRENGKSRSSDAQLAPFYAAGPVVGLGAPVQTKVTIGQPGDRYEREADSTAARVTAGLPAPSISRIAPGGLGSVAQRQEQGADSEEPVQETTLQRQRDEEVPTAELVQGSSVQRQEEGEEPAEEPIQALRVQRQSEDAETEEPVQENAIQRQEGAGESAEEPVQGLSVQRQSAGAETEEPVQETVLQRQEDKETEGTVQPLTAQRQADSEEPSEEPVQEFSLQRQEAGEATEEPVQELSVQRQIEGTETEEPVQALGLQRQSEDAETEASVQELALQRQEEEEAEGSVQPLRVQRQEDREEPAEGPVQEFSLQRQEAGSETEEPVQESVLQRREEAQESTEEPVQELGLQRQETEEPVQETALQRQVENEETVQSQQGSGGPGGGAAAMHTAAAHAIRSKGAGEAINPPTRNKLESSMGVDLSDVRVHQDGGAHGAARDLKARAFTHKNHIWLGPSESQDDLGLMAHESTHVLQQDGIVRRKPQEPDSGLGAGQMREEERKEGLGPTSAAPKASRPAPASDRIAAGPERPQAGAAPMRVPAGMAETEAPTETQERVAGETEAAEEEAAGPEAEETEGTEQTEAEAAATEERTAQGEEAEKRPEGEEEAEAKTAEGEEAPEDSDAEAGERLEQVMDNLGSLTKQQQGVAASDSKARATSKSKAVTASQAAPSPENEAAAHGKGAQVETMDQQEKGDVDKQSFLELVRSKLRQMDMPKNPKEMSDFKKRGGASGLKGDLLAGAQEQQAAAQGAIATATTAEPQPAEERKPVDLPPPEKAPSPRKIDAQEVLPPPKSGAEISLQQGRDEVEGDLAKEDLNKDRLLKANDPRFTAAQESREEVHAHTEQGPQEYRETEHETLTTEKSAVKGEERANANRMGTARKGSDANVLGEQKTQMSKEEKARQKIASDLEAIYSETKTQVDDKLKWLDGEVDSQFTIAETRARNKFENFVEDELDKWKDKRYSGLSGKWTWVKDRFRDINELPAAKKIYTDGQDLYFEELDKGIVDIGNLIDKTLAWCQEQIKKGREKVQDYLSNLDDSLKEVGAEAGEEVLGKFSDLKDEVNDYRDALADKLVQRYQESREKLNARLEEIKDANRSLVIKAKRKIEAVIEAIRKFRDRLMSILSKVRNVVELILDDPIGFLKNLLAAVKKGFSQFMGNIAKHLMQGVFAWLFGTFGKMGIELPKDFSVKSIVGFILQILGITWDRIRQKAVRLIGERNVAVIEKAVGYLSTLFREGPAGLWEEIKEDLGNLKDMVIEGIKDWLITKIITAAVTKIVSMFNPVGAIVQAVLTIYNVVMFFVERIDQILQLVETIIGSLSSIVHGNIDAAANFIERTMVQAIPIIISFLARLLGLGGIAERVKKIIGKVRRRVDKAIDKALRKIVGRFKGVAKGGVAAAKKALNWFKSLLPQRFKMSGRSHTLKVARISGALKITMRSSRAETLINKIDKARKATSDNDAKATLSGFRTRAEEIQSILAAADSMTDAKKQKKEKARYSKKIKELAAVIGKYGADHGLDDLLPAKNLDDEGKVGSYGSFGKQEELVGDHQPQNSLMKNVKSVRFIRPGVKSKLRVFGRSTGIGQYSTSKGIAMNMHSSRHIETRTFKTRGGVSLNEARTMMGADENWIIPTTGATAAEAREKAQEKVKSAVTAALNADRSQVSRIYDDPKWKLPAEVKNRAKGAESRVKSDNKSAWPEVFE